MPPAIINILIRCAERHPLRNPCAASPADSRKCSDFRKSTEKTCNILSCKRSKIGTFLNAGRRCGGGFLRGRIFVAPLKPTSLVTFLFGDKKVTYPFPVVCTKKHREPKLPVHPAIAVTHQFMTCTKRQVGCRSRPLLLPTSIYRQSVDGRSANRKGN